MKRIFKDLFNTLWKYLLELRLIVIAKLPSINVKFKIYQNINIEKYFK